jgi:hypothetical protein
MRKNPQLAAALVLILTITMFSISGVSAAAVTPQTLATKISKAGLGCKAITAKTPMLFQGTKWSCVINGEKTAIEVYPSKYWKDVLKFACILDIGFIAVSDNKSWMVTPESRATAKKLTKPLGGKLTVFCNPKNIINETKDVTTEPNPTASPTSAPKPSASPSPTPSAPESGTWTKPFVLGNGIKDNRFTYTPVLFEQDVTAKTCVELVEKFSFGSIGDLCPEGNGSGKSVPDPNSPEKYFAVSVDLTNNSGEIARPGSFSVGFGLADDQGKIYRPTITELTPYVEIDIVPNGTKRAIIYFQVPKSFQIAGARLEVQTDLEKRYWTLS